MARRPDVLDVLRPGYGELFDAVVAVAEEDDRVRAVWLHGSIVKGLADRRSDLDVMLTVRDEDFAAFTGAVVDWVGRVTPTVFCKSFFGRVVIALTADLRRLDLFVEGASEVERSGERHRLLVHEKEPVGDRLPPAPDPSGPNPAVVGDIVRDFVGELAMAVDVVVREDWLFGLESVHRSRVLLKNLLIESNRPLPPHGQKQWSAQLTDRQRAAFASMAPVTANSESFLAAKWSTVDAFYDLVPPIADELGVEWPVALEDAVRRHLHEELGYELPTRPGVCR